MSNFKFIGWMIVIYAAGYRYGDTAAFVLALGVLGYYGMKHLDQRLDRIESKIGSNETTQLNANDGPPSSPF